MHQVTRAGADIQAPAQAGALSLRAHLQREKVPCLVSPSRSKDRPVPESFPAFWAPVTAAADFPSGSSARSPLRCPPPSLPPSCAADIRPVLTHRTLSQPLILSLPAFPIPTHPSRSSSVVTSSRKPCPTPFSDRFASPALCPTSLCGGLDLAGGPPGFEAQLCVSVGPAGLGLQNWPSPDTPPGAQGPS